MSRKRVELVACARVRGANAYEVKLDGQSVGWLRREHKAAVGHWRHAGFTPSGNEWTFEPELIGDEDFGQACARLGIEWILCSGLRNFAAIKNYLLTTIGSTKVTSDTKDAISYPAQVQCQHHVCRCARAAELATMGMTPEAIAVHEQAVTCRMPGQHPMPPARPTAAHEDG